MKKLLSVLFIAFFFITAHGEEAEKVYNLSAKISLQNSNGFYILSDQTFWKVIGFTKRWRSLSEWWNNVQLVHENYECSPNEWHVGAQVKVYPKYGRSEAAESNASNQDFLKQCTHLMVNTGTGKILFAIALTPAECFAQLSKESIEEGYNRGYTDGRLNTFKDAKEAYNAGYQKGYKEGYREASQAN